MSTFASQKSQDYLQATILPVFHKLYGSRYKLYGPYVGKDGRKRVVVYSKTTKKMKSVAYAKLKLESHLGRKLIEGYDADHIDNDPSNDKLSNLQELFRRDNKDKSNKLRKRPHQKYKCPECGVNFSRSPRNVVVRNPTCSLSCRSIRARRKYLRKGG